MQIQRQKPLDFLPIKHHPLTSGLSERLNGSDRVQRLADARQTMHKALRGPVYQAMRMKTPAVGHVIQANMTIKDAPDAKGKLSSSALAKWKQFLDIMQKFTPFWHEGYPETTIQFRIGQNGGSMPAYTYVDGDSDEIIVTVENWFIDMSSPGYIAGMVNHEIGVHTLTDRKMGHFGLEDEWADNKNPATIKISPAKSFTMAGYHEDKKDDRQVDHVNVVKTEKDHENVLRERGQGYRQTFLWMGSAVENSDKMTEDEKTKTQVDMLVSLLFDIGQILATDDGGVSSLIGKSARPFKVMNASKDIEEIMAWYWETFVQPLEKQYPWIGKEELAEAATGTKVAKMLRGKVLSYAGARIKNPTTRDKVLMSSVSTGAILGGIGGAMGASILTGATLLGSPVLAGLAIGAGAGAAAYGLGALGYGAYSYLKGGKEKND